MIGPLARTATARPGYPNLVQQCLKLGALVTLTTREDQRKRPSLAVAAEVQLGGKPSLAPPQRLLGRV